MRLTADQANTMKAWPVRVVLATMLVGSLAAKDRTTDLLTESRSLEPAAIRVAESAGLTFRQNTTIGGADIRALVFDAAGCSQPVLVALLSLTFEEVPAIRSAREPGYALRYIYIERSWEEPPRLAIFVERVKYAALAVLGFTQFTPFRQVLLVESPPHCPVANDVDWRFVWSEAH
jgi:hypothetical protein